MPHFFINKESIKGTTIEIQDKELLKHLVCSLRIKNGETIKFFDSDKNVYKTKILDASKNKITGKIVEKVISKRYLDMNIYLMASILKPDGFFSLISGITQLGIKGLYPIYTDNTALSKAQIKDKTEKWQKISDESVKQCERADFMKIFPTSDLYNFDYTKFNKIIVFSEIEKKVTLKDILKSTKKEDKILVIVGPEGGFSEKEFAFFKEKKFYSAKISELIFKAENACISGISNIIYELGE